MGTESPYPGSKAAGPRSWPLISIECWGQECVELHLHFPTRLHGTVFSYGQEFIILLHIIFHLLIDFPRQTPCLRIL
jgi:hypothetical protein